MREADDSASVRARTSGFRGPGRMESTWGGGRAPGAISAGVRSGGGRITAPAGVSGQKWDAGSVPFYFIAFVSGRGNSRFGRDRCRSGARRGHVPARLLVDVELTRPEIWAKWILGCGMPRCIVIARRHRRRMKETDARRAVTHDERRVWRMWMLRTSGAPAVGIDTVGTASTL